MEFVNSSTTDSVGKTINYLPLPLKLKLLTIKRIQAQVQKLNNEFQTEVAEVLQKYSAQADSISLNANEVIEAKLMPNLEGTRNLGDYFTPFELERAADIPLTSKPFENYWFMVLINSKLQVAIIKEEEEILLHLEKVFMTSSTTKRDKRYKIAFVFKENIFFSNKEIICNIKYDHDNNLLEAKSNKIHWYPGQNIYKNSSKSLTNAGGFFKLFKRFEKNSQNELLRKYRIDISFIASELVHEILPNSFHYYMGVSRPSTRPEEKEAQVEKPPNFKFLRGDESFMQPDGVQQVNGNW